MRGMSRVSATHNKTVKNKSLGAWCSAFLKETAGFSLVELGVVLVIGAIMTIPIYTLLFYVNDLKPTDERMAIIQEALAEHLRVTGTLPCPADPSINIEEDEAAYLANCAATAATADVYIGALPIKNLKVVADCARNDGGIVALTDDTATALKDSLYSLGEIFNGTKADAVDSTKPENIRCPLNEYIMDEHGHKFVYAVSAAATTPSFDIFDPDAIDPLTGIIIENTDGDVFANRQPYVLISLGKDGTGGYLRSGDLDGAACASPATDLSEENCNADNVFVAAPENPTNANYFDDKVDYGIASFMQEDSFWNWGGLNGPNSRDMILNPRAMLTLGVRDDGAAGLAVDDDDGVVVNRGSVRVDANLTVHAQTYNDGSAAATEGGNLTSTQKLVASDRETTVKNVAVSGSFCYGSSSALTSDCGATSESCADPTHIQDANGDCCDPATIDEDDEDGGFCTSGSGTEDDGDDGDGEEGQDGDGNDGDDSTPPNCTTETQQWGKCDDGMTRWKVTQSCDDGTVTESYVCVTPEAEENEQPTCTTQYTFERNHPECGGIRPHANIATTTCDDGTTSEEITCVKGTEESCPWQDSDGIWYYCQ